MFSIPWGGFYSYCCLRILTCVVSESCHTRTSRVAYEWVMTHTHRITLNMVKRSHAYIMRVILCVCVVTHSYATWRECNCDDGNTRLHLLWVWSCVCVPWRIHMRHDSNATVTTREMLACMCYECDPVCVCHDSFICDMTRMQMLRLGKCWHTLVMPHLDLCRI